MALTYTVTGHLEDEDGDPLTGNVIFERAEWLTSSVDGVIPPTSITEPIDGSGNISQVLRATNDPQVSPEDWQWKVTIQITGQNDIIGFFLLEDDTDLADVFPLGPQPAAPDVFVTRQEFNELEDTLGNPASQAALDAEIARATAAEDAIEADVATHETRLDENDTDVLALQNADILIDGRLDDLEALGVPDPSTGSNDDVLQVQAGAYVLAPEPGGGGGGGGGGGVTLVSKDDASTTPILAPQTTPTAVDAALEIPVTIPASGEVLVHLEAYARLDGGTGLYWSLWDVTGTPAQIREQLATTGGTNPGMRIRQSFIVTGTPDEVIDVAWYHKREDAGNAHTWYGGVAGPALMWWEPLL